MSDQKEKMHQKINVQVRAYALVQKHYMEFADFLAQVFNTAVRHLKIEAMVTSRAKGIPEFVEKAIRKQNTYADPVNQLGDLCGSRIIVNTLNDIEPLCIFIRKYFDIDDAGTEDVSERLGASRFGYRSVHFTVSLNENKTEHLLQDLNPEPGGAGIKKPGPLLFEHRSQEDIVTGKLPPGPKFKAEVQVRTLLAHAWAAFAHDRVYKSDFDVPVRIKRDANRLAAMLEGADNEFNRIITNMQEYRTYFGAYMNRQEREAEMEKFQSILRFDPDNMQLAYQIARLAMSIEDYQTAVTVLEPFVSQWENSTQGKRLLDIVPKRKMSEESSDFLSPYHTADNLRDPHFALLLLEYGQAQWRCNPKTGHNYIKWACALDADNADARVEMAETFWNVDKHDPAMDCYTAAYRIAPSDPRVLAGMVLCKIAQDRQLYFIPLVKPSLEAAIKICEDRINAGIYLPHAFYDIGLFNLLLGKPYESLSAFAMAVIKSDMVSPVVRALNRIEHILETISRSVPDHISRHFAWVYQFLLLTAVVKKRREQYEKTDVSDDGISINDVKAATEGLEEKVRLLGSDRFTDLKPDEPIRIVAGGCDQQFEKKLQEYRIMLDTAFDDFEGTVFSGGTRAGVSGLVGDLKLPKARIRKRAYLPGTVVNDVLERHEDYEIFTTNGTDCSALEPLQGWIDLLAAGVDPSRVRLLGINGGNIAAFEFRMALALGATVGVIRESGRAALEILSDPYWKTVPGLIRLPADSQTLKEFIQAGPPEWGLDEATREKMARKIHEEFQRQHQDRIVQKDPSIADWEELPEDLKDSNRQLIDHIELKLMRIGYRLRKVTQGSPKPVTLHEDKALLEKMAEMEHARWNIERLLKGWTHGEKNISEKTSPHLVPWADLPDNIKQYDRDAVVNSLEMLQKYGYTAEPIGE